MVMLKRRHESGAVSLFIVVFAMLLITIVTLSFLRIMLKDQSLASINDLSKSALDSAQAGVEDAKRALIYYRTVCASSDVSACTAARNTLNSNVCNKGLEVVQVDTSNSKEVPVQQSQSGNDSELNQAYTCVKVQLDTKDYLGTLEANSSKIVPLTSTATYSSILLQWFTTDDFGTPGSSVNLEATPPAKDPAGTNQQIWPMLAQSSWPQTRPSVMRSQLMQYGTAGYKLTDFDSNVAGISNSNTIFLYPIGVTGTASALQDTIDLSARDIRQVPTGEPQETHCSGRLSGGGYACNVVLTLPRPVGNAAGDLNRTAYLRLTALYKSTHFRISFIGANVLFKGVQPSIDSTGRANDQYRRVEDRVDLVDTNFPFPEAALDVSGNLCKNFLVTDTQNSIPADQSTCN